MFQQWLSPKEPMINQSSANDRPMFNQLLTNDKPTINQLLTNVLPGGVFFPPTPVIIEHMVAMQVTNYQPTINQLFQTILGCGVPPGAMPSLLAEWLCPPTAAGGRAQVGRSALGGARHDCPGCPSRCSTAGSISN